MVDLALIVSGVFFQFRTRRYAAAAYWYLALAIATFGTGAADVLHLDLGLPYTVTTAGWAIVLAVVFWLWYWCQGTRRSPHRHPPPRGLLLVHGVRHVRAGHRAR